MEKLAADLKKIMPFKDTTEPGDIVLIAAREPEMLVYALVGEILRDETRKEEWWHVTLHILTVPPQTVVWTLLEPRSSPAARFSPWPARPFRQGRGVRRAAPSRSRRRRRGRTRAPGGNPLRVVK